MGTMRLANSLRQAKRQIGIRYNRVESLLFDLRYGTDTRGKAAVAELSPVGENVTHGTGYQAVNAAHFRTVMRGLPFPEGSVFVDIGCGKGKPLLLASTLDFIKHAVGVEFSGALCEIARRNATVFKSKTPGRTAPISVIHCDAITYEIEPDQNIFFLNNPFDSELTSAFLQRLTLSAEKHPRPLWLLYGNPAHRATMEQNEKFTWLRDFKFFGPGRDIAVFCIDGTQQASGKHDRVL